MSNTVKRISKYSNASVAVNNMIADMEGMWDGFKCDSKIIADGKWGAHVIIIVPMEDEPEAFSKAYIFRKGEEYICMADFYYGEGSAFQGTEGTWYTINDYDEMVEA